MPIEHGWTIIHIELTDVSFSSWLELENRDGEGKWSSRSTPVFITEDQQKEGEAKFEALQGLRYSTPKRALKGKASKASPRDGLYLGVPEDKSSLFSGTTALNTFHCEIHQLDEDEECRFGYMKYWPENYDYPETFEAVILSLHLPPSAFEELEQTVCSSDGLLSLVCHIKCHFFRLPDGDELYYVDKNRASPAELSRISLKKIVPAIAMDPDELENEEGLEEDNLDEPLLLQKFEKIETNIDSLKLPLWVAAIAAMLAAVYLIF